MKRSIMQIWCDKVWLYVLYTIGLIFAIILFVNWENWSGVQKVMLWGLVLLPLHVLEEWQLPGGFHYQYNMMNHSTNLNYSPMSRIADMYTNSLGELLFGCLFLFYPTSGSVLMFAVIGILEIIVHTVFGISMYKKFKYKGKRTIYGPGSITTYFGWLPLTVYSFYVLSQTGVAKCDVIAGLVLILVSLCNIFLPLTFTKKIGHKYPFASPCYFKRFL